MTQIHNDKTTVTRKTTPRPLDTIRSLLNDHGFFAFDMSKAKIEVFYGPDAGPVVILSVGDSSWIAFTPVTPSGGVEANVAAIAAHLGGAK